MPKLSIIVPAYNEEKSIAQTLKSLLNQTYSNYEIIVVNNNSTDETEQIAKRFVDKVVLEKKKGYHNAVNRGVKEAKGELITFCDADTIYAPSWVENLIVHFEDPEIIAVYGGVRFHDHNFIVNFASEYAFLTFIRISKRLGFDNTAGFNFAMRKSAYQKSGGYNPEIYDKILTDVELGKRLQEMGKLKMATDLKVATSSRRFKEDGLLRTTLYLFEAWYRLRYNKEQRIDYEEYNKAYGRDYKRNERWLDEVKKILVDKKNSMLNNSRKDRLNLQRINDALQYVDDKRNALKKRAAILRDKFPPKKVK